MSRKKMTEEKNLGCGVEMKEDTQNSLEGEKTSFNTFMDEQVREILTKMLNKMEEQDKRIGNIEKVLASGLGSSTNPSSSGRITELLAAAAPILGGKPSKIEEMVINAGIKNMLMSSILTREIFKRTAKNLGVDLFRELEKEEKDLGFEEEQEQV